MKNILSPANRQVLQQFAWSKVLLAFDYDGTLAPIVPEPERAVIRDSTRELLDGLARRYPCIVISGRAQRDALRRLRGVAVHEVVGNHGMEPWDATGKIAELVDDWRPLLERRLESFRGIKLEDKGFSLAVHYRQSREKKKARAAIVRAAAELGEVRLIGGKQVVNILPKDVPHKGTALERERTRLECDTAIYVGDDETDEDVFSLDQPGRLLSIRVGLRRSSSAAYYIESQRKIDELLRLLLRLREKGGVSEPPWGRRRHAAH